MYIWTSCKYWETRGRDLSSSASNYTKLEKRPQTWTGVVYIVGHINKGMDPDTRDSRLILGSLLTKLKVISRPILTQGLTLGTGVTLGGIGLALFRTEW